MTKGQAIVLLADELNQFAMIVEDYAYRETVSAHDRLEEERGLMLFRAARRLRERIAELIPE